VLARPSEKRHHLIANPSDGASGATVEEAQKARSADMRSIPRSMLFTPATKSGHFTAAAAVGADAVILDLEDSVAPAAKDDARLAALNYLAAQRPSRPYAALRINSPATLTGWRDLTALLDSAADPDFLVIPKAESATVAALLKSVLGQAGKSAGIIAIMESAGAVARIGDLLDPRVVDAVMFGAADMSADLGADVGAEVTGYARSVLLTQASAAAIPVIDSPFFVIADSDGLQQSVTQAVAEGFAGKAAIHPAQIPAINAAFTPDEDQIAWAKEVLDANTAGVGTVDGSMVDEAVARRASRILHDTHH
jgi:(S)-citramalyl-CoA lyase